MMSGVILTLVFIIMIQKNNITTDKYYDIEYCNKTK